MVPAQKHIKIYMLRMQYVIPGTIITIKVYDKFIFCDVLSPDILASAVICYRMECKLFPFLREAFRFHPDGGGAPMKRRR